MPSQPPAPVSLPQYLADRVPKQDDATLRDLQAWIDALLEYRDRPLDEDELIDADESLEDVEATAKGTIVVKKVPCGKDNCRCASGAESDLHGPYRYEKRREGDKVVSEYLGKANE